MAEGPQSSTSVQSWPPAQSSPPSRSLSPDFHGFGPQTHFPQQLILDTEGQGEDEILVKVSRKKKSGRPSAGWGKDNAITEDNIIVEPRLKKHQDQPSVALKMDISSLSSLSSKALPKESTGSSSRPKVFLLGKLDPTFKKSKLPKGRAVLSHFLYQLEEQNLVKDAAEETLNQVKDIWKHHFGMRVVFGYDSDLQEDTKKMIIEDIQAKYKITSIWKQWMELERTSRRPDRASKPSFRMKLESFEAEVLDMPFNIAREDFATILKDDSGITDWKEDAQHLHNQLQREQPGTCDSLDMKQKKKDDKKVVAKMKAEAEAQKVTGEDMDEIEDVDEDEVEDDSDDSDFEAKKPRNWRKDKKKVDIMGPVAPTADRLGLSVRERCMMAASVANTLGVDLDSTNISRESASRRAREERVKIFNNIQQDYKPPDDGVVQWDGKILKTKGNHKSERVCVYFTGATCKTDRKLLGAPETKDGTGAAEAEVVKELLNNWNVKKEIRGMVFDTTSSNSGAETGACKCLEDWLEFPVLWLACRHHMYELHLKRVVQGVLGKTTDPGLALFRRLRNEWNKLEIDYSNLSILDYTLLPDWLQQEAKSVLAWAERELEKNTWPREDYRELLRLAIVVLGGTVPGFQFLQPGPDHHARWMSKAIYFLKMKLLLNSYQVSDEEKLQIEEISMFVVTLYVKPWFQSPLPSAAARNDLAFMANLSRYRLIIKPSIAMSLLQSCYRHTWYLVPQTVVFALADAGLANTQREEMAKKLHSQERKKIVGGKPVPPYIDLSSSEPRVSDMSCFISSDSWLVFDLLGLSAPQDWMTIPVGLWENFADYKKFRIFAENISVCNDIAERGVALITAYINKAQSEEQREALLQVVEFHRELVTNTNKSSLKLC